MAQLNFIPRLSGLRAGHAFGFLGAAFILAFGIMVALVALDQQRVLEATARLQEQTVPEIIRYQRLARNLEQLRQEGERVFSAGTPQARQQAMFVVTLWPAIRVCWSTRKRPTWRGRPNAS